MNNTAFEPFYLHNLGEGELSKSFIKDNTAPFNITYM